MALNVLNIISLCLEDPICLAAGATCNPIEPKTPCCKGLFCPFATEWICIPDGNGNQYWLDRLKIPQ